MRSCRKKHDLTPKGTLTRGSYHPPVYDFCVVNSTPQGTCFGDPKILKFPSPYHGVVDLTAQGPLGHICKNLPVGQILANKAYLPLGPLPEGCSPRAEILTPYVEILLKRVFVPNLRQRPLFLAAKTHFNLKIAAETHSFAQMRHIRTILRQKRFFQRHQNILAFKYIYIY